MKKLVWFNFGLLAENKFDPRLEWHTKMSDVVNRSIILIDSTNTSKRFGDGLDILRKQYEDNSYPDIDNGQKVDLNFYESALHRVDEMYDHAERNNYNNIKVAWSGGIDSSFLLAAIMQHPRSTRWLNEKRIVILTTKSSMIECPKIWNWLLDNKLPINTMSYETLSKDKSDWMLVTGDGDPYSGSFYNVYPNHTEDWKNMERHFLSKDFSGLTWDYFKELLSISPDKINSCYHAWWWFERNVGVQDYSYRILSFNDDEVIDPKLLPGKKIFYFLSNKDFSDHSLYTVVNHVKRDVKSRLIEYIMDWQKSSDVPRYKFFSQSYIPKISYKWQIYDDLTWSNKIDFDGTIDANEYQKTKLQLSYYNENILMNLI
jgi:hypothetical protein